MRTRELGWAWAPYRPDSERPWNLPRAGHLYRRAAFGADWSQLQQALARGPQTAVEKLLDPGPDAEEFDRTFDRYRPAAGGGSADGLRAWWLRRMIATPHPLLEKMTLFWHGHFAVSNAQVQSARLIEQHVDTLRTFALDSFASMTETVSRDPAVFLAQPATPHGIVRKLYRWLISEADEPAGEIIAPLAESFQQDYDIRKLLETMLRSNLFFSASVYRRRVKSPVEFAIGVVRGLEGMVSTSQLAEHLAAMGQNVYHPPTVKGWAGGRAWLSGPAMLARANLATALLSGAGPYGDKLKPQEVAARHGNATRDAAARFLIDLFLQGDVDPGVADVLYATAGRADRPAAGDPSGWLRRFAHGVVTLPEFQLA